MKPPPTCYIDDAAAALQRGMANSCPGRIQGSEKASPKEAGIEDTNPWWEPAVAE